MTSFVGQKPKSTELINIYMVLLTEKRHPYALTGRTGFPHYFGHKNIDNI